MSSGTNYSRQIPLTLWHKRLIAALSTVLFAWTFLKPQGVRYMLDANVYRLGAQRVIDGLPLYNGHFHIIDDISLPFTYPPISALLFLPLTVFGNTGTSIAVTFVNLVLLITIVWILLHYVACLDHSSSIWLAVGLSAILTQFGPVYGSLMLGQINLFLGLLVLLDATLVPRKFRGLLTGIATALKLTPAVFGLWFVMRRDWASLLRMGLGALGMTALGFLVLPQDSKDYWLGTVQNSSRIGGIAYASNQSFNGELFRLGLRTENSGSWLWLVLVATLLLATVIVMRRLLLANMPLLALCLNSFVALLASPVSWAHHFIWVPIMLIVLGIMWWDTRYSRGTHFAMTHQQQVICFVLVVTGAACFALQPISFVPSGDSRELEWGVLWHIIGNAFLWWTLAAYPLLWRLSGTRVGNSCGT
ncbi:glycosyltransferase family 87 protein [Corynebacterium anserum]|uniref:DUF2029 domain-containing protein n=1 Tax=Corynebacterium anserum TaxID=2684406 RepID=A0A7G7YLE3_9CORY|nr:glycosyltransferase family 87 protein [Corynebacterium anserum]MBC2682530.1 DUF2029 domain-containing protein [Corynebacterium anserum]QNH95313.1 DUF2029 domain-containing protein [Corynebacterium anserum]